MTWQILVIFSLFFAVVFTQFYKLAVKDTKNDGAATILLQLIAGVSVLFWTFLFEFKFSNNWELYLLLFLACVFYALNDRMKTTARKHLEVSEYSIMSQMSSVFMILIGIGFLKDPIILTRVLGGLLVIIANMILLYEKGKFVIDKYMLIALISALFLAVGMSIDVGISKSFNLPIYIAITLFIPAILIFIFNKIKVKTIIEEVRRPVKKFYLVTGVSWGLMLLFLIRSYQLATISIVTPLFATTVLLNVIVGYFIFKEKTKKFKKIIAALIIILGVYLTVLK
jgi:drug/metabolite transporter (DMT)-like permease